MSEQTEPKVTPVREPAPQMPPFGMDWRDWLPMKAKLAKKKSNVMAGVDTIPKNGYNPEHQYYFARDADINDCLRDLLHKNDLSFDIEFINRHHKGNVMEVMLEVTWTDCETGYFETRKWLAAGFDTVDKGIYKAYTGGAKYYLMRTFLMSQGDTDPEIAERNKGPFEQQKTPPKTQKPEPEETRQEEAPKQEESSPQPVEDTKPEPDKQPTETKRQKAAREKAEAKAAEEAEAAKKAAEQPKDAEQPTTPDKAEEAANEGTGPIRPDQADKVRLYVKTLSAFATEDNKEKARDGIYTALGMKPPLKEWWARISKEESQNKRIEGFTEAEADKALEYLVAWNKAREDKANVK